jgi:hypothetical protein
MDIVLEKLTEESEGSCRMKTASAWKSPPGTPGSKKSYTTPGWVRKMRIDVMR